MYRYYITAIPLATLDWFTGDLEDWLPTLGLLALLAMVVILILFALADWRSYRIRAARRGYRHRRTAHERFAASVDLQRRAAEEGREQEAGGGRQVAGGRWQDEDEGEDEDEDEDEDENELLRRLLGQ
ncbi:MAG: hypothetical protein WCK70_13055 [Chloroflexales bacterium]|jgi:hypothetical protein